MVSVIIPAYNVGPWLGRAIKSMVTQTWTDLEIIVINDGSTDNSLDIAMKWAKADRRVSVHSYPNGGLSAARNRGLRIASGDYIVFLDGDDWYEPDAIERMMKERDKHNADIVISGFSMDYPFGIKFYRPRARHKIWTGKEAVEAMIMDKGIQDFSWGKLFKRECFQDLYFPEGKHFEDIYTIYQALIRAERVVTIPDSLVHYVQRRGSITNRMSLARVEELRAAYHTQHDHLEKLLPNDPKIDYSRLYYNTDMVLIYTLLLYSKRKDRPSFHPDAIDMKKLPLPGLYKWAYDAFLGLACLKFGWNEEEVLSDPYEHQKSGQSGS